MTVDVDKLANGISRHVSEQDFQYGVEAERERIIELLSSGEHAWQLDVIQRLFRFSWKQRCRCGFYGVFNDHLIALIKGENKHTHEIEVFGAPCLDGDYHEYCLKCGWVEPCEIDGENN